MVTNEQRRRQLAREKFERQQQRREAQRRKARNRNALIAAGLAVLIAAGGTAAATGALGGDDKKDDKASADATPSELPTPTAPSRGPDPCAKPAAGSPAKKTWKSEPEMTVDTSASYTMALKTTCGNIDLKLDAAKAPHTVNSLNFLAGQGYFDHTKCHRLTGEAAGIYVLQCGDPQGTGAGGPGYTLAEENLKSDLLQEPKDEQLKQAKMKIYPAGTIAMAKTQQPHSTGSQFFLVYKDSPLQPDYTPVGTIGAEGRKTLDKIAGAGIQGGAPDGPPNATVVVDKATVVKS
ncbi:peptidylprolyl isomerase [Streptomyces mobaraensis NBRC 13819 = DSM 40847]|uniref:Peptidyl-prolyl cis-trans isomerase n=1 Tax=Streptomyces mobaraensis (strain ATCC 29032 / DSM 40847 / JCM 4168 / NBRC 13819 / NCIMB 11159 / IPCR 16-22) TaxID=1223523 RepID=M3C9W4_STRM1|nr:peptidylprolyl isomerase [Streptomyces mobaraensis]EMF00837.1 peptidyl-prolyl cis-trans isomerase [Streptomyces mobaraensis NBRC 13819 = DSM 40847]QTT72885.1 peptidylprolyl isomerase [Streptomyces mobaraensis NBRC 13819 = DSM 40847]